MSFTKSVQIKHSYAILVAWISLIRNVPNAKCKPSCESVPLRFSQCYANLISICANLFRTELRTSFAAMLNRFVFPGSNLLTRMHASDGSASTAHLEISRLEMMWMYVTLVTSASSRLFATWKNSRLLLDAIPNRRWPVTRHSRARGVGLLLNVALMRVLRVKALSRDAMDDMDAMDGMDEEGECVRRFPALTLAGARQGLTVADGRRGLTLLAAALLRPRCEGVKVRRGEGEGAQSALRDDEDSPGSGPIGHGRLNPDWLAFAGCGGWIPGNVAGDESRLQRNSQGKFSATGMLDQVKSCWPRVGPRTSKSCRFRVSLDLRLAGACIHVTGAAVRWLRCRMRSAKWAYRNENQKRSASPETGRAPTRADDLRALERNPKTVLAIWSSLARLLRKFSLGRKVWLTKLVCLCVAEKYLKLRLCAQRSSAVTFAANVACAHASNFWLKRVFREINSWRSSCATPCVLLLLRRQEWRHGTLVPLCELRC